MAKIIDELIAAVKGVLVKIYEDNTGIENKLDYLKRTVLKLHSAIEIAEDVNTQISLGPRFVDWMKDLEDTVKEAEAVLRVFNHRDRKRPRAAENEAESSNSSSFPHSSSESSWNIRKRVKRWISGDEDVKRLNETVRMLQNASGDIKQFHEDLNCRINLYQSQHPISHNLPPPVSDMYLASSFIDPTSSMFPEVNDDLFEVVLFCAYKEPSERKQYRIGGCLDALIAWFRKFISRNEEIRTRVEDLLTKLSVAVESVDREECNGKPWLLTWLARMRQVETEGRNALETMKYPWNNNGLDALAEKLEMMLVDWEEYCDTKRLVDNYRDYCLQIQKRENNHSGNEDEIESAWEIASE